MKTALVTGVLAVSALFAGQRSALADPPFVPPPVPSDYVPVDIEPGSNEWYHRYFEYLKALYAYLGGNPDELEFNTAEIDGLP